MEQRRLINGLTKSECLLLLISDAGRATQQIIETLEGCLGVSCLAHKGV